MGRYILNLRYILLRKKRNAPLLKITHSSKARLKNASITMNQAHRYHLQNYGRQDIFYPFTVYMSLKRSLSIKIFKIFFFFLQKDKNCPFLMCPAHTNIVHRIRLYVNRYKSRRNKAFRLFALFVIVGVKREIEVDCTTTIR